MTQLSPNFTLEEMTRSDTASRLGIANMPDAAGIVKLTDLCIRVLEPIRAHFALPVLVNSGYRSPELNAHIPNSATKSQHMLCEAVDYHVPGVSNHDLAAYVRDHMQFDQLILEAYTLDEPASGWVHTSWIRGPLRHSVLTMQPKDGRPVYSQGLLV